MVGPGSSNVVGGQFLVMKTHGRVMDQMVVKEPAAMKVAFGENPKTNYSGQNKVPSTRMSVGALLRDELTLSLIHISIPTKQEDSQPFPSVYID